MTAPEGRDRPPVTVPDEALAAFVRTLSELAIGPYVTGGKVCIEVSLEADSPIPAALTAVTPLLLATELERLAAEFRDEANNSHPRGHRHGGLRHAVKRVEARIAELRGGGS